MVHFIYCTCKSSPNFLLSHIAKIATVNKDSHFSPNFALYQLYEEMAEITPQPTSPSISRYRQTFFRNHASTDISFATNCNRCSNSRSVVSPLTRKTRFSVPSRLCATENHRDRNRIRVHTGRTPLPGKTISAPWWKLTIPWECSL